VTNLPIVDTHLHIWDPGNLSYPWLADAPKLNRPHLLDDYRRATDGIDVEKMVFVQCETDFAQFREEVAWVTEQAQGEPPIRGIVAWAPLENGDSARADLEELAANPLVKGIRRIIQFEDDPEFCLRPEFVCGVQLLADFGMSFDICIKGDEQFRNTIELARQCSEIPFILDHIGKPFIKEKALEPWATCMRDLAALPNTWCKMSGLVNEADWEVWTPGDLRPYIDHVLNTFGFARTMFGGDWPVCTLATEYRRWFETLRHAVEGVPEEDLRSLFHDNAIKFYRL